MQTRLFLSRLLPSLRSKYPQLTFPIDICKMSLVYLQHKHRFIQNISQRNARNDLKDLAVCICVECESKQRKQNLLFVVKKMLEMTNAPVYIYETGFHKTRIPVDKRVLHTFTANAEQHYSKTKYLNAISKRVSEKHILFLDTDILLQKNDLEDAYAQLTKKSADIVYPYNGLVIDIDIKNLPNLAVKKTICPLSILLLNPKLIGFGDAIGGALLISKKNFTKIKGFNERIVGWGYEDTEFIYRAKKLGLQVKRTKSFAIHLRHERNQRSLPSHKTYDGFSIFQKIKKMTKYQLEAEVKSWNWF